MDLVVTGLHKTYPNGVRALRDVSLTIPPGLFGLLGPNGAGKSTLMRTLATLQDADAGTAHLGAIDLLRAKEEVRRLLGYLPQEFGVYPRVTAFELLDHLAACKGLGPRQRRWDEVHELLRRTNLYDARHRRLGTFSGGMKQRFGIAQALLGQPRLVIVDEPTAGLDPEERTRFHNLLADIGEDVIVILSTHIVADVADLCPRMAVVHDGRVVLTGDPTAIVAGLRGRVWRKEVAGGEQEAEVARARAAGLPPPRMRRVAGRSVCHVIADVAPDAAWQPAEPDLEDAYFLALGGEHGAPAGAATAATSAPAG
jgi:ABC-type multidrug transport system ATPase subunit